MSLSVVIICEQNVIAIMFTAIIGTLEEATTLSQSLRLFFFKYFLVKYFKYLWKELIGKDRPRRRVDGQIAGMSIYLLFV